MLKGIKKKGKILQGPSWLWRMDTKKTNQKVEENHFLYKYENDWLHIAPTPKIHL